MEEDGPAGVAPVGTFSQSSPGSNSVPNLAKTEPISVSANKCI